MCQQMARVARASCARVALLMLPALAGVGHGAALADDAVGELCCLQSWQRLDQAS